LLRLIAGLDMPKSGDIRFDGHSILSLAPAERDVGMVFQNYALYPHLTVWENLAFPLLIRKEARRVIDQQVRRIAALLHLESLLDRKPRALSGGQQQRVALGRALIRQPRVFLLDEPLSNLDAQLRQQMRKELVHLQKEVFRTTTLYVTHDQTEAMTMGDRIALLYNGQLQQIGTPQEVYHRPANQFVAGFIGSPSMNFPNIYSRWQHPDCSPPLWNLWKTSGTRLSPTFRWLELRTASARNNYSFHRQPFPSACILLRSFTGSSLLVSGV